MEGKTIGIIIIGAPLVSLGCASIKSDVRIVDQSEGIRHVERVIPGKRSYRATAEVDGSNLVVALTQEEVCEIADIPQTRRQRITTRTELPRGISRVIWQEYLLGALGLVVGGLVLRDPKQACTSTDSDGNASMGDPHDCVILGWSLAGAGVVFLGAGVYDSVRVSDRVDDLGVHDEIVESTTHSCNSGPVVDAVAELRLRGTASSLRNSTSNQGKAAFSMSEAPEDAVPSPTTPAQVVVGDASILVTITDGQHDRLVAVLRADAHSRTSRDLATRCGKAFDEARKLTVSKMSDDRAVADARAAWQRAKDTCGPSWISTHQAARQQVEKVIADNRADIASVALRVEDLKRADQVLTQNPEIAETLSHEPRVRPALRKVALQSTRAILSGEGRDSVARFCLARSLFTRLFGDVSWRELLTDLGTKASQVFGGSADAVAKRLEAICVAKKVEGE